MFNLLEGDGLIENIYHLIWTKDSIFGIHPYVILPNTIIYKYSKPCYWYFSSRVDSKLKKKSSSSLTTENIKNEFLKYYDDEIGIVATFTYKKSLSSKYNSEDGKKRENEGLIIEYLNKSKFIECIESKMPCEDGILQKFESPI